MSVLAKTGRGLVRAAPVLGAVALLLGATGLARAEDFFEFLGHAFGGGAPQSQPQVQPSYGQPDSRPLTVRARPHRHRMLAVRSYPAGAGQRERHDGEKYDVAELKGVTMYTDKTLSRGDAVMTPTGIKVFNGSASWPYKDDDFVALSSGRLPSVVRKELTAMDNASRPALQR